MFGFGSLMMSAFWHLPCVSSVGCKIMSRFKSGPKTTRFERLTSVGPLAWAWSCRTVSRGVETSLVAKVQVSRAELETRLEGTGDRLIAVAVRS